MASQKLEFLRKLDPNLVIAEMKKRGGGAPAAAPAAAPSGGVTSAQIFAAIAAHVEKNAADLTKIGVVYLFKLTGPDSQWTVDLKACKVSQGEAAKAECTLELADSDFMDMTTGKADPQKLYFGGKLKISGNVMASQKLGEIFKKMDPAEAKKAVAAAAAPAAAPPAASAPKEKNAEKIFAALGKRLAENTALGAELGKGTIQFTVDGKSWLVSASGVKDGSGKADATLTISDEPLTALVRGQRDVRDLHQRGELRVDGDVHFAQKLGMLKGLV
jgi:3-hydroxyacyl-CoA dehydrogenase/3a,7a,12a-trihydroxy-5b-cholest-24-enoyl-CoA hydratase